MGTRSLTRVKTTDNRQYINLYRQFDGYPKGGHGEDLFNFLSGFQIVNGYNGSEGERAANGAGCLAAQLVAHFKTRQNEPERRRDKIIGGFYLYPVESTDCGQEYEYIVTVTEQDWQKTVEPKIEVEVIAYDEKVFTGSVEAFGEWCQKDEEEEE